MLVSCIVLAVALAGCSTGGGKSGRNGGGGGSPFGGGGGEGPGNATQITFPTTVIESAKGPLTRIWIGVDLACQVERVGDAFFQMYPPSSVPGDCGTLVAYGGHVYGPSFSAHPDFSAAAGDAFLEFGRGSQTKVRGTGVPADPFVIETTVLAGPSLRVFERDSYVEGDDFYTTEVTLRNVGPTPLEDVHLYRAGDCFLGSSDGGYGFARDRSVGCSANPDNEPTGRIEQWIPLQEDGTYGEGSYDSLWWTIADGGTLDDFCKCTEQRDNAAALLWRFDLAAGAAEMRSHRLLFSGNVSSQGLADNVTDVELEEPVAAHPSCAVMDFQTERRRFATGQTHLYDVRNFEGNWTVTGGAVDLYRPDDLDFPAEFRNLTRHTFADLAPTLAGPGVLHFPVDLGPGTYVMTAMVAGNHRVSRTDFITLGLDGTEFQVGLAWQSPWGPLSQAPRFGLSGAQTSDLYVSWNGPGMHGPLLAWVALCPV